MTDLRSNSKSIIPRYELMSAIERVCSSGFTGALRLKSKGGIKVRLYVDAGQPRLCVGTGPEHTLGGYLARSKLIKADALRQQIRAAKDAGIRLEEQLVTAGVMDEQRLHALRLSISHMVFGEVFSWKMTSLKISPGQLPGVVSMFRLDMVRAVSEFYFRWFTEDPQKQLLEGGCGLIPRDNVAYACELKTDTQSKALAHVVSVFGDHGVRLKKRLTDGLTTADSLEQGEARCLLTLMSLQLVHWKADQRTRRTVPEGRAERTSTRQQAWTAKAPLGKLPGIPVNQTEKAGLHALLQSHRMTASGLPPLEKSPSRVAPPEPDNFMTPSASLPPVSGDTGAAQEEDALSLALAQAVAVAAQQPESELSIGPHDGLTSSPAMAVDLETDGDSLAGAREDAYDEIQMLDLSLPGVTAPGEGVVADATVIPSKTSMALAPAPDAGRTPPTDAMAREVWDMRVKVSRSNHYSVLDLVPGAPLSSIRDRYVSLRAHFDSSVFGNVLDIEGRADLDLIGRVLDRVVDDLTDQDARTSVEEALGDAGMNAFQIQMYFDAERAWREAKKLADQRDYPAAIRFLDRACELNGREPEYAVWRAEMEWDRRVAEGRWDNDGREWVRKRLSVVVSSHPEHVQARVVLARAYLELADEAGALEQYQSVLKYQPRHVEALGAVAQLKGQITKSSRSGTRKIFGRFRKDS